MEVRSLFLVCFMVVASFHPVFLARSNILTLKKKVIVVEYFENCDQKVYPVMFVGFSFVRNGSVLVVNGEEIISRDVKNPIKILIDKCKDKSNPDTCEYYTTWRWDDMCVAHKLPFVKAFVDAHTPPMTCPMKKNHYYVKNARLQADLIDAFLAHNNPIMLWKFRVKLEEEGATEIGCVDLGVRLMTTRVRL